MFTEQRVGYKIRLTDGSTVIERNDLHCHKPHQFGNWLLYTVSGWDNQVVFRDLTNGQEYPFTALEALMDYETVAFDGRFIATTGLIRQGKWHLLVTIFGMIFDTQAKAIVPGNPPCKISGGSGTTPNYFSVYDVQDFGEASPVSTKVEWIDGKAVFTFSTCIFLPNKELADHYEQWQGVVDPINSPTMQMIGPIATSTQVESWL